MKNAPDWLARGAESDGRSIWGMNWLAACMVGCSQQSASKAAQAQSAPKSASEASVVEMPAYLDVQANPDKYGGVQVAPLPGLVVPPGVFVPVLVDATIDAVPRRYSGDPEVLVDLVRSELTTSSMPRERDPDCAIGPTKINREIPILALRQLLQDEHRDFRQVRQPGVVRQEPGSAGADGCRNLYRIGRSEIMTRT